MVPDAKRVEEIIFYCLIRTLRAKFPGIDKQKALFECLCVLTEDEGTGAPMSLIIRLREDFLQASRYAPTDDEIVWTLYHIKYSFGRIARYMSIPRSVVSDRFYRIKNNIERQRFYASRCTAEENYFITQVNKAAERLGVFSDK